jgi:hypothetical protein
MFRFHRELVILAVVSRSLGNKAAGRLSVTEEWVLMAGELTNMLATRQEAFWCLHAGRFS